MREIIVTEFISLDGVVEAPGGEEGFKHTGWTVRHRADETMYAFKFEETLAAEGLVIGRPDLRGLRGRLARARGRLRRRFNTMPKYVVSTTLERPDLEQHPRPRQRRRARGLKHGDGGPLLVQGSPTLAQALYDAGLVDEWRLMTWPVILGSGKRLFPDSAADKAKLTLADCTTYANGVQLRIFRKA